jgi:hypothetical protein
MQKSAKNRKKEVDCGQYYLTTLPFPLSLLKMISESFLSKAGNQSRTVTEFWRLIAADLLG